jgi:propanol-preferring alcohol dehydrogenase
MRKTVKKAMAFVALKGVRPMVETHPLDEAGTMFQNMSKAHLRAVLTI